MTGLFLRALIFGFALTAFASAQTTVSDIADNNANCTYTPSTRTVDCFSSPDDPGDTGYPLYEGIAGKPASPVNLIFGNNEVIVLDNTNQSYTLNVTGDWTFGNNLEVNVGNDASQLTINIGNNINPGNNANINANLTVGGSLNTGNNTELEGGLTIGGNLNLGNNAEINGIVTVEGDANIGNNVTINGDLGANNINTGNNTEINGNVEGNNINVGSNSVIDGSVNATGSVNNNGTITGYVNAPTVNDNSGNIEGETCDQNTNVGPCSDVDEATDTSSGTGSFVVPDGVTSITVELWGAGGSGADGVTAGGNNSAGGGGGGGGAFVRRHLSATPGETFEYFIGSGSGPNRDSWFQRPGDSSRILLARGGSSGSGQSGGAGGPASTSIGVYRYSGGDGANGMTNGGGGGASAGTSASGSSASGQAGASGSGDGGSGGDGATATTTSDTGSNPGGGGGGGIECNGATGCTTSGGSDGANGKIRFLYEGDGTPNAPDHIDIRFNTTGLTCEATEVTFVACADGDCTSDFTESTVSLTASPSAGWVGGTSLSFTGRTTVDFNQTSSGTVTLGAGSISPTPTASPAVTCNDSADCDLDIVDAGLLLTDSSGNRLNLSDTSAGTAQTGYYLSAVRDDGSDTGACEAAIEDASQPVDFSAVVGELDSLPATQGVLVNSTEIATALNSSPASPTTISLAFNSDGRTTNPLSVTYNDVGEITLSADTMVTPVGTSNSDTLPLINGGPFVVYPAALGLRDITCTGSGETIESGANTGTTPADLDEFCTAGNEFTGTLVAFDINDNELANFGSETNASDISLSYTLVAPSPGNNGSLMMTPGSPATDARALTLTWDEVGVFDLTATLESSYLGGTLPATNGTVRIGRFVPAYFSVAYSGADPALAPAQSGTDFDFTYQGQTFGWATAPRLTLTALNANDPATTTTNYKGAFASLGQDPGVGLTTASGEPVRITKSSVGGDALSISSGDDSASWTDNGNGTHELQVTPDADWTISKPENTDSGNETVEALTLTLDIDASVFTDADNIVYADGPTDPANSWSETIQNGQLVYGRIRLEPGQARGDQTLSMRATAEVWCEPESAATTWVDCQNASESGWRFWSQDSDNQHLGTSANLDTYFEIDPSPGSDSLLTGYDFGWRESNESGNVVLRNGEAQLLLTLNKDSSTTNEQFAAYTGRFTVTGTCDIPVYLRAPWARSSAATCAPLIGPQTTASFGEYTGRPPVLFILPQAR